MLVKPVIPVFEYVVFYDYIKNELCVNKDNKAMHCDGKCHLKKELAKASNSDSGKQKGYSFSVESSSTFCEAVFVSIDLYFPLDFPKKVLFSYNIIYKFNFSELLFRPPVF